MRAKALAALLTLGRAPVPVSPVVRAPIAGAPTPSLRASASLDVPLAPALAAPAAPPAPVALFAAAESTPPPAPQPEQVAYRMLIKKPGVYAVDFDGKGKDDSTGVRISDTLDADALFQKLRSLDVSAVSGRKIVATGVEMGDERRVARRINEGLGAKRHYLGAPVAVLSVPRPWSDGVGRAALDRVRYFWWSRVRDHQTPLRDEVTAGLTTTAALEAPNAAYLISTLPWPTSLVVLGLHSAMCAFTSVYQRSLGNWIIRSGPVGSFAKNLLVSLPFVLNYNLLAASEPFSLGGFAVTQGLTLALQTVFYSSIVIRGFRGWAAAKSDPGDAVAARAWVNVLLLPWLWLDSIFVAQASMASTVLGRAGPFTLTGGHVSLALLIAAGWLLLRFPALLDWTLRGYRKLRKK